MKNKKLLLLMIPLLVLLAGCGTGDGDQLAVQSSGISWTTFNFYFSWIIVKISEFLGGNLVYGVIVATILVRLIMLPVYNKQIKSQEAMQTIQPQIKKIQKKYEGKTTPEARQKMAAEQQALYKKEGVSPLAGCLPTLLQMPILFVFYGAIRNLFFYTKEGLDGQMHNADYFLTNPNMDLSAVLFGVDTEQTGLIIFAITAGIASFLSMWVSTIGQDKNAPGASTLKTMMYVMPVMMMFIAYGTPGAMAIYLTISSLFSFFQSLYFKRAKISDHYQKRRLEKK